MNNIRAQALLARREMTVQDRDDASRKICNKVTRSRQFLSSGMVACYLPMRQEVDTRLIIKRAWRANKRVFVPVTRRNGKMFFREIRPHTALQKNSMSIWEPDTGDIISPRLLQLIVTPTVAFDADNRRIGMGGGYYDRCFSFLRHRKLWIQPKLVGVAFKCQEVEKICPNTWDIPLYRIVTDADQTLFRDKKQPFSGSRE